MNTTLRQLIVNADDYGYSAEVSRGILECHLNGIVTSTSVMINMPAAEQAVASALENAPKLGLGLHLNLVTGKPLSPQDRIPDLVDGDGRFLSRDHLLVKLGAIPVEQILIEFEAQYAAFQRMVGHDPDHIDSHHHISYLHPNAARAMLNLLEDKPMPIRNPLKRWDEDVEGFLAKRLPELYADQVVEWSLALPRLLEDIPSPKRFVDRFYAGQTILGDLLNVLMDTKDGVSELMCHPG
ncbi:MAG: ChbG/HpnK family deacetylase, partial [Chloroflexi bacterium]|nr:ChbG/HpnK family deacetylase [Chloroflexota bacterium]